MPCLYPTPMTPASPTPHPDRLSLPTRRQALAWLVAPALTALPPVAHAAEPAPARVVASFSLLADMLRQLLPVDVEVQTLVGPDGDAHAFEPTPADARRLVQASLVVVNGLGFEGWMSRLVQASGYRGTVVVAAQQVQVRRVGPAADPHAWQDVGQALRYVAHLAAALVERWPGHATVIRQRAAAYTGQLQQLDADIRRWLAPVPREQRRVVTSHDAFGYFGAAYGVDFLAAQGWNAQAEPSAAAVARLQQQVRLQGVRALFLENMSDPRLVQRIAADSGVRVGGTLYADALSRPGGPADSYLRLMDHNARTIVAALGA